MKFKATQIDAVIDKEAEKDDDGMALLNQLSADQPAVTAYLAQENFNLLTLEEHDYLIFLFSVIHSLYKHRFPAMKQVSQPLIEGCEEANWDVMNASTARKFHDRLDPFFEEFEEEDLLAFVEDAISDDEIGLVSQEGREPMFIALKTIIDVYETVLQK